MSLLLIFVLMLSLFFGVRYVQAVAPMKELFVQYSQYHTGEAHYTGSEAGVCVMGVAATMYAISGRCSSQRST